MSNLTVAIETILRTVLLDDRIAAEIRQAKKAVEFATNYGSMNLGYLNQAVSPEIRQKLDEISRMFRASGPGPKTAEMAKPPEPRKLTSKLIRSLWGDDLQALASEHGIRVKGIKRAKAMLLDKCRKDKANGDAHAKI